MILRRIAILLFALAYSIPAIASIEAPDENDLGMPVYSGMQFIDYSVVKDGIPAARFCSDSSVSEISKFYKNTFPKSLEIQEGTADGMKQKLLLDVTSPLKWRESRRFIEIYTDNKKTTCKTMVLIAGLNKVPAIATEKVSSSLPVSTRRHMGIGGYANTLNFSAGPTLILWPTENFALQGSYGVGTFTSYEARGLYRFNRSARLKPYIGVGYIHAEKKATVIGVDTTISGDSFSTFGGVETALYKNLYLYTYVSYSPMKVETDVRSSSQSATAKVEYAPVTVGIGLLMYIW